MKILKVSDIVAGIHLFALIIILANPGCSSSTKAPSPSDTVAKADSSPVTAAPTITAAGPVDASAAPADSSNHITFNPASATPRYSPTRPGTAVASTLQTETVVNATPATTYTVVSGDSLSAIAKKNKVTAAELAAANNLNLNTAKIRPGQKLIIPTKTTHAAEATPTAASTATATSPAAKTDATANKDKAAAGITHVVKNGESLSTIARKYGVKQGDIAVANNITDPAKIYAGMTLTIPGWDKPGGKNSGKSSSSSKTAADASKPSADTSTKYPNMLDTTAAPPPQPAPPPEVPVIKVEDAPASKP